MDRTKRVILEGKSTKVLDRIRMYNIEYLMCSFEGAILQYSSIAQLVEHAAVNRAVVGSSPTRGVFLMKE